MRTSRWSGPVVSAVRTSRLPTPQSGKLILRDREIVAVDVAIAGHVTEQGASREDLSPSDLDDVE